jgi:hypothetical protein
MDLPAGCTAFTSFQDVSVDFATANNQIFRNLSLVLTGDQVLLLLEAVRAFPQERIYNSVDEHRRNGRMAPYQSNQESC